MLSFLLTPCNCLTCLYCSQNYPQLTNFHLRKRCNGYFGPSSSVHRKWRIISAILIFDRSRWQIYLYFTLRVWLGSCHCHSGFASSPHPSCVQLPSNLCTLASCPVVQIAAYRLSMAYWWKRPQHSPRTGLQSISELLVYSWVGKNISRNTTLVLGIETILQSWVLSDLSQKSSTPKLPFLERNSSRIPFLFTSH